MASSPFSVWPGQALCTSELPCLETWHSPGLGAACTPEGWPVGLVQARGGCPFPGCPGLPHPSPSPPPRVGLCEGHLPLALVPRCPGSWQALGPQLHLRTRGMLMEGLQAGYLRTPL